MINFQLSHLNNNLLPHKLEELFDHNNVDFLQNCELSGFYKIKELISQWLNEKYDKSKIKKEQIFMTHGYIGTIQLLLDKYCEAGDSIIVDNPSSNHINNIFDEYGLNVEKIDIEDDGIDINILEEKIRLLSDQSVVFYYIVPTYQEPTGSILSQDKRILLGNLCDKYNNFYIIADETNYLLSTHIMESIANYSPKIISIGCFSKLLAPGIKVGWIYQNTMLPNYKLDYSFIEGVSGLNRSAILLASGFMNSLGCRYVEKALETNNNIRFIDNHIKMVRDHLHNNNMIVTEYLEQFNNIEFIKPKGGHYFYIMFKTVKNINDLLKICIKNNVKFDTYGNNYGALSFMYYDTITLINGIDIIFDCIVKYNHINIIFYNMLLQNNELVKELSKNKDFNIDCIDTVNKSFFEGIISYNTIFMITSNDNINILLSFLLKEKIYLPILISVNKLSEETMILVNQYSKYSVIAHITNFSYTDHIMNKIFSFNKLLCKKINNNKLELTNGSDVINIEVIKKDMTTYYKDYMNHIYWMLSLDNGFYKDMFTTKMNTSIINNITFYKMNKELHPLVFTYEFNNINGDIIVFIKDNNSIYKIEIYKIPNKTSINYCIDTMLETVKYIENKFDCNNGIIEVNNYQYQFKIMNQNHMIEIPYVDYNNDKSNNDNVSEIINTMTNLFLLGICRYKYCNDNYLILEIKNNVLEIDILDTITTLINDIDNNKSIIFVSYNNTNSINIRVLDINTNKEIDNDIIIFSSVMEYYIYHFSKNVESLKLKINMINNKYINLLYHNDNIYLYK
jgi:DNA-binding transcriptional MocR family regulator